MKIIPNGFKQGDSFRLPFSVKTPAGVGQDLSSWTIQSHLRQPDGSLVQIFTIELVDGGIGGQAVIRAAAAETANWPEGYHWMDIQVTDAAGEVYSTVDIQLQVKLGQTHG